MSHPPNLSRDTATVLKLKILNEGIRRIPLSNIWDVYGVSYSRLVDLVLLYSSSLQKSDAHRIIITYTDEDGDIITISSDQELEDAFVQFKDKIPSVVRATVSIYSLPSKEVASTQTNDQQEKDSRVSNHVLLEERVSRLEDKVAKMLMKVHDHDDAEKELVQHGDGQKQDHVANSQGTPSVKIVATKAVQVKPNAISKATGTNHKDGSSKSKDENGSKAIKNPKESTLECFDPAFIHGRHTCDGCFTTPILGYRFHAVNLPDYDLCYKCFKNYKGCDVFFQPEELERDRQLQSRWRTKACKKNIQGCATVPARKCNKGLHVKKVKEIAQDIYDAALNEAIRRSLIVEQKKDDAAVVVEATNNHVKDEVETPMTVENTRAQEVREKVVVEDVTSQCENLQHEEDEKIDAELHIPVAPTHCPEDVPKHAIDPLSMEIETSGSDDVPDDNNFSENEATKKGNDSEEDVKSTCSSGTNDWQVVDENGQNTDYMVAQAAQLIGSSLFQSDMASDDHHGNVQSGDSVTSGLTSIPSIKSKSEISSVLLARWENELRQLNEFGFVDDHANVEALGYLEAANIGVDSDDPIPISAVVDYLLKQKKMD